MPFGLKAIVPKISLDTKGHLADVRRRVKNVQEQTRRDFQRTTKTWKRNVKFSVTSARGPNDIAIAAGTDDRIYGYVDQGTEPHIIRPKKPGGVLRFQPGYKAKTRPNFLGSESGGSFGPFVTAKQVFHPGTRPRNFTLIISIKAQMRLTKELSESFAQFAQKARRGS